MIAIRKMHLTIEETEREAERPVEPVMKLVVVAAVVKNPWAGHGFVEDLRHEIRGFATELGSLLSDRLVGSFGPDDELEAYGKSSVVGVDGELEHANAVTHTLMFGNPIRAAVGGESILVFANTRGGPGCQITVPMVHKTELTRRSHYQTATAFIADAPRGDEIVVAMAGASRGRPFPRIGDRDLDRADIEAGY